MKIKSTQQALLVSAFDDSLVGTSPLVFAIWCYALARCEKFSADTYAVTLGAHYLSGLFSVTIDDVVAAIDRLRKPDRQARHHDVQGGRRLIHIGTVGVTGLTRIFKVVLPEAVEKPKPKRTAMSPKLRFEILKRDRFRCRYCGASPEDSTLHVDHMLPVSKGGPLDPDNLAAACALCNIGKFDVALSREDLGKYRARFRRWCLRNKYRVGKLHASRQDQKLAKEA